MKFSSVAALFSFAAVAVAVDVSQIPQCALVCFAQGAAAANCGVNDLVCQCTTGKDALTKAVTPCVQSACNSADQAKTAAAAIAICQEVQSSPSGSSNSTSPSATSSGSTTSASASTNDGPARQAGAIGAGVGMIAAMLL